MTGFHYIFVKTLAVIAVGFLLKQAKVLSAEHGKYLSRIILNVTLPAVILKTISSITLDFSLAMAPAICLIYSAGMAILSGVIFGKAPSHEKGIGRMASVGFNIGFFGYPVISGLFGLAGLSVVAMFDLGNAFAVFGISYLLGYLYSEKRAGKKIDYKSIVALFATSVPFMCYLAAIVMNLSGVHISGLPLDVLDILAQANTGMALIVLGLMLDFRFDASHWKLILKVLSLRFIVGLTAGLLLYRFLPFSHLYRSVILLGLLLPTGIAIIPYAVEFRYDARVAGTIANFTMIISFLLLWFFMFVIG